MSKSEEAAVLFVSRKSRSSHPDGNFDNANRWHPSRSEKCSCCDYIRAPSRTYPYSRLVHCRSFEHICNLKKLTAAEIKEARKIVRSIDPAVEQGRIKREETRLCLVRAVVRASVAAMPQYDVGIAARVREHVEGVKSFAILHGWEESQGADALDAIAARAYKNGDPCILVWLRLAETVEEVE